MNLLGCHVIPAHFRNDDIAYAERLNPSLIKFVDADPHIVDAYYARCPAATYWIRDWALSEQKEDMKRDPKATGIRHARERMTAAQHYNVPKDRLLLSGINEPAVWEDFSVVPYTTAFLTELASQGYRGAALNLSVGWPANTGEGRPPDWSPFLELEQVILDGDHVLSLHEYWDERGPAYNWGWWAGRLESCPMDVPIVLGEFGLDKYVADSSVDPGRRGWKGWLNAQEYAEQVHDYLRRIAVDGRVVGTCLYSSDFSHPWDSFDTADAHGELIKVYVEAAPFVGPPEVVPPVQLPDGGDFGSENILPTMVHPCGGHPISQHFYENADYYARFNMPGHDGTDISVPVGTPVVAPLDCVVAYIGVDDDGYGRYLRLYSEEAQVHFFFGHLSEIRVNVGQKAMQSAVVALTGNTGNSTGPHLHIECRLGGENGYSDKTPMANGRVDPETVFAMGGVKL